MYRRLVGLSYLFSSNFKMANTFQLMCLYRLVNCLGCCVDKSPEFSGKKDCDGLVMSAMGTGREVTTCLTIS